MLAMLMAVPSRSYARYRNDTTHAAVGPAACKSQCTIHNPSFFHHKPGHLPPNKQVLGFVQSDSEDDRLVVSFHFEPSAWVKHINFNNMPYGRSKALQSLLAKPSTKGGASPADDPRRWQLELQLFDNKGLSLLDYWGANRPNNLTIDLSNVPKAANDGDGPWRHVTNGPGPTGLWCHHFPAPHQLSVRPGAHEHCSFVVRAPPPHLP